MMDSSLFPNLTSFIQLLLKKKKKTFNAFFKNFSLNFCIVTVSNNVVCSVFFYFKKVVKTFLGKELQKCNNARIRIGSSTAGTSTDTR